MLYHLLYALRHEISGFNVVRYITFRTAVASLTALFLVLILGPWMIERLRRLQIGQYIREEGPQAHQAKKGTPTMGGLLILAGIVIPTLLWADLTNRNVWIAGPRHPRLRRHRLRRRLPEGREEAATSACSGRSKLCCQLTIGLVIGVGHLRRSRCIEPDQLLDAPDRSRSSRTLMPDLGLLYILVRGARARGLRSQRGEPHRRPRRPGHRLHADRGRRLHRAHLRHRPPRLLATTSTSSSCPRVGEVTVFCGAMVGASMGFLWWNCYPAQIFMGDVGSLALGGALGTVAILIKQELLLFAIGGLFVIEALSVILQVVVLQAARQAHLPHGARCTTTSSSSAGRRPQIIVRFWIVAFIFALLESDHA